jgi:DNA-binding NtrC family response regulator
MKIVILNDELRSEMQMYLALSHRHNVQIAQDVEDLFQLLEEEAADFTFVDLSSLPERDKNTLDGSALAKRIIKKHPRIKVVGICDADDQKLQQRAANHGISEVITRPIKNRELLGMIER